ncbi:lipid-binding SYLF domain-containing protein [Mucilaginibacter sp. RS28]|uniref:Lipid-binding SYLF domain-containing protein n=1 Tax=Mucilaginibacter straminoryzae TaxID=2932774 RepID=A0A9X1X4Q2_9SPHI|nr:lipid-binding SYLF domain-containing protein [Mucilaginibacter straminoryzae]MCJ8210516.1 lipid-binding SYLF domain-containing protein [Mucilaginibacter straminoryzae]
MKTLKAWLVPAVLSLFVVLTSATDAGKEQERIQKATVVLQDFKQMKETIPSELMQQAEGIVVIPKLINAGFAIGGKRGRGVALVKLANGEWSNPVFVTLTGGSFGFQIGVQAVDLVLVFKHRGVLTKVENGDFTIGGDISAAAGPVGRSSSASTDYKLDAEVYSYSRSKGLFAGITISGSNIGIDKTSNANFYGSSATSQSIFANGKSTSADVTSLKQAIAAM